jgi:hypothetical protein
MANDEPDRMVWNIGDQAAVTEAIAKWAADGNTYAKWLLDIAAADYACPHCGKASVGHIHLIIDAYTEAKEKGEFT